MNSAAVLDTTLPQMFLHFSTLCRPMETLPQLSWNGAQRRLQMSLAPSHSIDQRNPPPEDLSMPREGAGS